MNQEEYQKLQKTKMMHANVDVETGEVISLTIPYKPMKSNLGGGWMALYQDAINWVADENLKNEEYRVFLKLLGRLDFENYLRVTQTEMAKELGMKQPNVAKAIKRLTELDIIRKGPKLGNINTYRLNPYIGHKGQGINKTKKEYEHLTVIEGNKK